MNFEDDINKDIARSEQIPLNEVEEQADIQKRIGVLCSAKSPDGIMWRPTAFRAAIETSGLSRDQLKQAADRLNEGSIFRKGSGEVPPSVDKKRCSNYFMRLITLESYCSCPIVKPPKGSRAGPDYYKFVSKGMNVSPVRHDPRAGYQGASASSWGAYLGQAKFVYHFKKLAEDFLADFFDNDKITKTASALVEEMLDCADDAANAALPPAVSPYPDESRFFIGTLENRKKSRRPEFEPPQDNGLIKLRRCYYQDGYEELPHLISGKDKYGIKPNIRGLKLALKFECQFVRPMIGGIKDTGDILNRAPGNMKSMSEVRRFRRSMGDMLYCGRGNKGANILLAGTPQGNDGKTFCASKFIRALPALFSPATADCLIKDSHNIAATAYRQLVGVSCAIINEVPEKGSALDASKVKEVLEGVSRITSAHQGTHSTDDFMCEDCMLLTNQIPDKGIRPAVWNRCNAFLCEPQSKALLDYGKKNGETLLTDRNLDLGCVIWVLMQMRRAAQGVKAERLEVFDRDGNLADERFRPRLESEQGKQIQAERENDKTQADTDRLYREYLRLRAKGEKILNPEFISGSIDGKTRGVISQAALCRRGVLRRSMPQCAWTGGKGKSPHALFHYSHAQWRLNPHADLSFYENDDEAADAQNLPDNVIQLKKKPGFNKSEAVASMAADNGGGEPLNDAPPDETLKAKDPVLPSEIKPIRG